jgi:ABC-type glutathione transport system ATPase component
MSENGPILVVEELRKVFRSRSGVRSHHDFVAVADVSFAVNPGESLAIVGESGSGKTTVARMIVGLEAPTAGKISVCGEDRSRAARSPKDRRRRGRQVQIVFQDPYVSLDRSQRVANSIDEIVRLHFRLTEHERRHRVAELLEQVGLDERAGRSFPKRLSGGQRQRVAIARALAAHPRILILDEAVSALDVSIQAQVLNRLADIREETGMTYVLISHDLAVVRQLTDQAVVMRAGEIVERGTTASLLDDPKHAYTRLLRDSVPEPGWKPSRDWIATEDSLTSAATAG